MMVAMTPGEAAVMNGSANPLGSARRAALEQLALGHGLAEVGVGDLGHRLGRVVDARGAGPLAGQARQCSPGARRCPATCAACSRRRSRASAWPGTSKSRRAAARRRCRRRCPPRAASSPRGSRRLPPPGRARPASTASPRSWRTSRSRSAGGRGRLPTWVVRIRCSLRFISPPSALIRELPPHPHPVPLPPEGEGVERSLSPGGGEGRGEGEPLA